MSLEDTIRANTEAILLLTETIIKQQTGINELSEVRSKKALVELTEQAQELKTGYQEPEKIAPKLGYEDVRKLILELASAHLDAIKALNVKYGLKTAKDMLVDRGNPLGGVKDTKMLHDYFDALLDIKNG